MAPAVSVVFLAFNRREELRMSLEKMQPELAGSQGAEMIVVDNASTDGTAEMLAADFADVNVIARGSNCGVSGFNDGFAAASGEWVLALDDDCHLPDGGLWAAVDAAEEEGAELVSFGVRSGADPAHRFDVDQYVTGLMTFWGCAVLMRREVIQRLGGYDPRIFVWANEVEFLIRFYDAGFRHLYLPDVVAVHAKAPDDGRFLERTYRLNARHWAYTAGKLLRPRDAILVWLARLGHDTREGLRKDRGALRAMTGTIAGFIDGLRHREPVRADISRLYRQNFEDFASPMLNTRPLAALLTDAIRGRPRPVNDDTGAQRWRAQRPRFYPRRRAALQIERPAGAGRA